MSFVRTQEWSWGAAFMQWRDEAAVLRRIERIMKLCKSRWRSRSINDYIHKWRQWVEDKMIESLEVLSLPHCAHCG